MTPIPMSGPTLGPTPLGDPQGNRRVSFGLCLMRRQDKVEMVTIMEMMAMVELLDQEMYRYNRREYQLSI